MTPKDKELQQLYHDFPFVISLPLFDFFCTKNKIYAYSGQSITIGLKDTQTNGELLDYRKGLAQELALPSFLEEQFTGSVGVYYNHTPNLINQLIITAIVFYLGIRNKHIPPIRTYRDLYSEGPQGFRYYNQSVLQYLAQYAPYTPLLYLLYFPRNQLFSLNSDSTYTSIDAFQKKQCNESYIYIIIHQDYNENSFLPTSLERFIPYNDTIKNLTLPQGTMLYKSTNRICIALPHEEKKHINKLCKQRESFPYFVRPPIAQPPQKIISQSLGNMIYSSYSPLFTIAVFDQKQSLSHTLDYDQAAAQQGIIVDMSTCKLLINQQQFTSKKLPSQKMLLEVLILLLKNKESIQNTQLPQSSYAKNKNTFESKIALPFNKLLESFGYNETAIQSTGSLHSFSIMLKQQGVRITTIQSLS